MTCYAIISDIHSNLEALEAVLAAIETIGVDKTICLGDLIGYNAAPREVLEVIMKREIPSISGNHDRFLTGQTPIDPSVRRSTVRAIEWTRAQLSAEQLGFLEALPTQKLVDDTLLAVHGSPRHKDEYMLTIQIVKQNFDHLQKNFLGIDLCFFGHTHAPLLVSRGQLETEFWDDKSFQLEKGKTYMINPGSVGQPRDTCPKACFAVLDTGTGKLELRRVDYDVESAQKRITEAGLDKKLALRLQLGK